MNAYIRMIAKILTLGVLLTAFGINAHAAGVRKQADIIGEVVGTKFESRHIFLGDYETEKRYRVALSAKITLLDGSKGTLEDVDAGDEVRVTLDGNTGDIRGLAVISQH